MRRPQWLLFDLGGVLIDSSVFEHLSRLLPEAGMPSDIKDRWLRSPSVRLFESGEITATEFAQQLVAEWKLGCSSAAFLEAFASWPRSFFPGVEEAIFDWRKSYKVACLSNSNPLHCTRVGNLDALFDVALFSHRLGMVKPDRAIFQQALSTCGAEPAEIYFFDDSPINVRSAQSLGMKAFCVQGFEAVRNVLRNEGLVT